MGPKYRLPNFFEFAHLPPFLQAVSKPFYKLAHEVADQVAEINPETEMALRKLLEAKDCAVRAVLK